MNAYTQFSIQYIMNCISFACVQTHKPEEDGSNGEQYTEEPSIWEKATRLDVVDTFWVVLYLEMAH